MIKRILLLTVIFFFICNITYGIDLSSFSNEIKKYGNDFFPELSEENLVENMIENKTTFNATKILDKLFRSIHQEFQSNLNLIFQIIGISFLCTILKSLQSNFEDTGISEIAFYVCYVLVIILIMTSFTNIVELCQKTICTLSNFMEFLIPVIISFLAVTGKITTIAVLQPILLAMISIITVLLSNVILPVILISTVIHIISNISERINIKKLSELLKKSALWCTEIALVIFAGVLSVEGTLSSSVDGVTAKATKSIVSNAVPVVGKLLGDTVDSVIGGINLTKSAVGTVGIIAIIAITLVPLVRILILMISFNLASAIIEPIADNRIVRCMSGMADSIKIIFGVMVAIIFLFIISISIMIKVTNG